MPDKSKRRKRLEQKAKDKQRPVKKHRAQPYKRTKDMEWQ